MTIRFLKLSLASPESIRSWTERTLSNGNKVGKILKGDLIDYKNGLPIRDGLNCERIFGPVVSYRCSCGRFKCFETRGIHIVHDYGIPGRSDHKITKTPFVSRKWHDISVGPSRDYVSEKKAFIPFSILPEKKDLRSFFSPSPVENRRGPRDIAGGPGGQFSTEDERSVFSGARKNEEDYKITGTQEQNRSPERFFQGPRSLIGARREKKDSGKNSPQSAIRDGFAWSFFGARYIDMAKIYPLYSLRINESFCNILSSTEKNSKIDIKLNNSSGPEAYRGPLMNPWLLKENRLKNYLSFRFKSPRNPYKWLGLCLPANSEAWYSTGRVILKNSANEQNNKTTSFKTKTFSIIINNGYHFRLEPLQILRDTRSLPIPPGGPERFFQGHLSIPGARKDFSLESLDSGSPPIRGKKDLQSFFPRIGRKGMRKTDFPHVFFTEPFMAREKNRGSLQLVEETRRERPNSKNLDVRLRHTWLGENARLPSQIASDLRRETAKRKIFQKIQDCGVPSDSFGI